MVLYIVGKCGDSMGYDKIMGRKATTRKDIFCYVMQVNSRKLWVSYGYERIGFWRVRENFMDRSIKVVHIDCVKIGNRGTFMRGFDGSELSERFIRKKWINAHDVEMLAGYLRSMGKKVVFCNCVNKFEVNS